MRKEVIGNATLYLGDAHAVLPEIGDGDVVTDPPYGIGFKYATHDDTEASFQGYMRMLKGRRCAILQYPEEMMRLVTPILGAPDEVMAWVYGSNLPRQLRLWGFWGMDVDPRRAKQPARNPDDIRVESLLVNGYDWREFQQVKNTSAEKTGHPCQLPMSVAKWVLECIKTEHLIDPFLGSGTMAIAALDKGYRFSGIEIDPEYFQIACQRVHENEAQVSLF
jgi:site-specific DNA-methyltransferase (adenine-specific)